MTWRQLAATAIAAFLVSFGLAFCALAWAGERLWQRIQGAAA